MWGTVVLQNEGMSLLGGPAFLRLGLKFSQEWWESPPRARWGSGPAVRKGAQFLKTEAMVFPSFLKGDKYAKLSLQSCHSEKSHPVESMYLGTCSLDTRGFLSRFQQQEESRRLPPLCSDRLPVRVWAKCVFSTLGSEKREVATFYPDCDFGASTCDIFLQ